MLRAIIIDDEQFSIDSLLSHIELIRRIDVIAIYRDPIEALNDIKFKDSAEIIFMDIDMPNLSGIELSKSLRSKTKKLIFTTAHSIYAFDSYEVDGDAFLLKPITFAKFSSTINKLFPTDDVDWIKEDSIMPNYFLVKNKDENLRILNVAFDDVIAFESANNYVKIHTKGNKIITAYLTLNDILGIVANRMEFKQFHRAFIISTNYISYIDAGLVKLTNNLQFNVGVKYKNIFETYINAQLLRTSRPS